MTEEYETIEVRTSCGGVFHERIDDLDNWQIAGLIEQNPDHAITPTLKKVLARRLEAL